MLDLGDEHHHCGARGRFACAPRAMLVAGLLCNLLVRPVAARWFMSDAAVAALQARQQPRGIAPGTPSAIGRGRLDANAAAAWLIVGVPLLWGSWIALRSAFAMLGG